ncbi:MAG: hypothetical protein Kow00107_04040 [Planctomycetota bacterium]
MRKALLLVAVLALLAIPGCAPKKKALSPEAAAALENLKAEVGKRVEAAEVDRHIQDTMKRLEDARAAYPEVAPDEWDFLVILLFYNNRKYTDAYGEAEKFLGAYRLSSLRPEAILMAGYSSYMLKEYLRAAELYDMFVDENPESEKLELAMYNCAANLFHARDEGALDALEEVIARFPDGRYAASSHQLAAILCGEAEDYTLAANHAFEYLLGVGYVYTNNDRVKAVAEVIEKIAAEAKLPDDRIMATALAALYYTKAYDPVERKTDAKKAKELTIKLGEEVTAANFAPFSLKACYAYAALLPRIKDYEAALEFIAACEPRVQGSELQNDFFVLKVIYTSNSGTPEETLALYESATPEQKKLLNVALNVGRVLEDADRYSEAMEVYKLALEANPNDGNLKRAIDICSLIGAPAPEIEGTNVLTGQRIKLSDLKGKVVLIDFWATWCGPCIRELPNVKAAYKEFHDKGFEILGVSLDQAGKEENFKKFLEDNEMPWPQIYEGKYWDITPRAAYKFNGIPFMVLVDRDGIVRLVNKRGQDLAPAIESLLK